MELVVKNEGMTMSEIRDCMGVPEIEVTKTAIYKHKNKDGDIIYVGIATSAMQRSMQHLNTSDWKEEIATIDVEWVPNRLMAEVKEIELIKELRPKYNKTHNDGLSADFAIHKRLQNFLKTAIQKNQEELANYYGTIDTINYHNREIKKLERWKRKTKKEKARLEDLKKEIVELNEALRLMQECDEIDALLMEQILMTESPNRWIEMQLVAGVEKEGEDNGMAIPLERQG